MSKRGSSLKLVGHFGKQVNSNNTQEENIENKVSF